MKSISLKSNKSVLATENLYKYRNPVIYYYAVLQYGNNDLYDNAVDFRKAMHSVGTPSNRRIVDEEHYTTSVTFNQQTFRRNLTYVSNDRFVILLRRGFSTSDRVSEQRDRVRSMSLCQVISFNCCCCLCALNFPNNIHI